MLMPMFQKPKVYSELHAFLFWMLSGVAAIVAVTIWVIQPVK